MGTPTVPTALIPLSLGGVPVRVATATWNVREPIGIFVGNGYVSSCSFAFSTKEYVPGELLPNKEPNIATFPPTGTPPVLKAGVQKPAKLSAESYIAIPIKRDHGTVP